MFIFDDGFWPSPSSSPYGGPSRRRRGLSHAVDLEFDFVWNLLLRLGVRRDDVEDAVNDVFLLLHEHLESYDKTRPRRPWIFAFVFRVASEYRRKQARSSKDGPLQQHASEAPSPEREVLANESLRLVQASLDALDMNKRAVFVLHELEDMAAPEIALALDVPVNTVYSRLRLARAEFDAHLKRLRLTGLPAPNHGKEAK